MTECGCFAVCTNPRGDEAVKALHAIRHREFEEWLAERRDVSTFQRPTPAQLITRIGQEFEAAPFSTACASHAGVPPHGAHR